MKKKSKSSRQKSAAAHATHSPLAVYLGQKVRERREQIGMTQETLANTLDVTPLYVSAIENGRRLPSLPLFLTLANTLGSSLDDLAKEE